MKRISNSLTSFALLSQLSADAFVPNLLSLTRRQPSSIDAFDDGGTNRKINGLDNGSQATYEDALSSINNEDGGTNNFFPSPTERSIATTSESYSVTDDDDVKDLYFVNIANTKDDEEMNDDDQQSPPWRVLVSVEVAANIKAKKDFESELEQKVASKPVTVNMSVDKGPTTSTTTTRRSILDEETTTATATTTTSPPRRPSASAATGRSLLDDRVAINTEGRTGVSTRKSSSSSLLTRTINSNKSGPRKLLSDEEMERTMINDDIKSPHKVTGKPLIDENSIGRWSSSPASSSSVLPRKTDRKLLSDEEMERTTINDDIKSPHKVTRKSLLGKTYSRSSLPSSPASSSSVLPRKTDRKLLSDEEMERTTINDDIKSPHKVTRKSLLGKTYSRSSLPSSPASSSSVLPRKTDRKLLSDEEMERTTINDDIKSPHKVTRKSLLGKTYSRSSLPSSPASSSSVLPRKTDRKLLSDEEMERTTINDDIKSPRKLHKVTRKSLLGKKYSRSSLPSSPASSSSVLPRKTPGQKLLSDEEIERTTINDDKNYPHKLTRKPLVGENNRRSSSASSSSSVLPRKTDDRKTDEAKRSILDGLTTPYTLGVTDETPMLSRTNNFAKNKRYLISDVEIKRIRYEDQTRNYRRKFPQSGFSTKRSIVDPWTSTVGTVPKTTTLSNGDSDRRISSENDEPATSLPGVGGSSMLPPKTTNGMAVEDTPTSTDQTTPVQPLRGDSPFNNLTQGQIAEKSPFLTPPKPKFGVGSSFEGVETDSVEKNTESLPFNGISPSKNPPMPKAQVTGSSPFTAPAASSFGIGSGNTASQNTTTTSTTSDLVGNFGASFDGKKSEYSNFNGFASSNSKPQQPRKDSPGKGSQNSVPSISAPFGNAGTGTDEKKPESPKPESPSFNGGATKQNNLWQLGESPFTVSTTTTTSDSFGNAGASTDENKSDGLPSFNGFAPSNSIPKPQIPGTSFQAPAPEKPSSLGALGASGSSFLSPNTTTAQTVGDAPTSSDSTDSTSASTNQITGSSADEKKSVIPSFNGFAPSTSVAKPQTPGGTLFQPPEKISSFGANGSSFPAQTVGSAPTLFNSIGNTADSSDKKVPLTQVGGVSSLDNKPKIEAPGGNPFAAPLNSPFGAGGRSTLSQNTTTTETNLNADNRTPGSPGVNAFSSINNELKPGAPRGNPLNSPFGLGGSSSLSQDMTTTEAKVGTSPLHLNGKTNLNTDNTAPRFPSLNDFSSSDDKPTPGGNPFASPPTSPLVAGGSGNPSTLNRVSTASSNLDGKTGASTDLPSSNSISGLGATGGISFGESLKKPIAASESNTEGGSSPMSQNKTSAATHENQESGFQSSYAPQIAKDDELSMSENKALLAGMMSTMALSSANVSADADTDKITPGFSSPPWGSTKMPFVTQDKSMSPASPANLSESKNATAIGAGDSMEVKKSGFFEQLLDPSSTKFKAPGKPTEASPSSLMDNPKGTTNTLEISAPKSPSLPRKEIEQLSAAQQRVDELQTQVDELEVKKQETTMKIWNIVPPGTKVEKGESAKPGGKGAKVEGESIKDALARLKSEAQAKKAAGIQGPGNTAKSNEMIPNGTSPETMPSTDTTKAKSFEFQRPAAQSKVKGKIQEKLAGLKSEPQDSGNSRRSNEMASDAPSTTDEFGNVKPVLQLAVAKGVQVIMNWKQNVDGSISGYVYNSLSFENGTRITTTPCINVAKAGYLIETESGSQYLLDTSGDVKPVLSLAVTKAVKAMMKWKENNRHGSIEGYMTGWKQNSDGSIVGDINSSDIRSSGIRVTTTPCVRVGRVGYLIETESSGQYILE